MNTGNKYGKLIINMVIVGAGENAGEKYPEDCQSSCDGWGPGGGKPRHYISLVTGTLTGH